MPLTARLILHIGTNPAPSASNFSREWVGKPPAYSEDKTAEKWGQKNLRSSFFCLSLCAWPAVPEVFLYLWNPVNRRGALCAERRRQIIATINRAIGWL
jgi:hypothetical protein